MKGEPMAATEELKKELDDAIRVFNLKRVALLQSAFERGGDDQVMQLESEYDALRDSYFELVSRELDENNHRYDQLVSDATDATRDLSKSISTVGEVATVIDRASRVVNLVGRLLITLGV
jgi:hypothetical protein